MSRLLSALPDTPSLNVGDPRLWVLRRQFPDSQDSWDGNWLNVVAVYSGIGSRVEVSGPFLDTVSFVAFRSRLEAMASSLTGSAELSSVEPELRLMLSYADTLGHVEGWLELTSDHLREEHRFKIELDQTHLPELIRQLRAIETEFPTRGVDERDA